MKPIRDFNDDEVLEFIEDKPQALIKEKNMPVSIARLYANIEYLHNGDLEEFELHAEQITKLLNHVNALEHTVEELLNFKKQQTIVI